jgi:hypothetical protein
LIATALSKVSSANGKLAAEPRRKSTRPRLIASAFRAAACATDSRDIAGCGPFGQKLNAYARTETNFQYVFIRSDIEQFDDPGGALPIRARHDEASRVKWKCYQAV